MPYQRGDCVIYNGQHRRVTARRSHFDHYQYELEGLPTDWKAEPDLEPCNAHNNPMVNLWWRMKNILN